jgi:glycosyltransferase involved in cell wall biosynthesis
MRAVFLFVGMPIGGAEDFAIGVHPHLAPEIDARFICLRNLDVLGEEIREKGMPIDLLPLFPSKRINPISIWRFSRWLRREHIDILHTQTYHAHLFGGAAAKLAGIPFILHQQKTLERLPWRRHLLFSRRLRAAKVVVTLSPQTKSDIVDTFGLDPAKIEVLPNAIDETRFVPAPDKAALRRSIGLPTDVFLCGTVASLHEVKNHRLLIQAMAAGVPDHVQCVLVGDGAMRPRLEHLANELGLGHRIRFVGSQRPASPWFQALDLFVLPSSWEGQPLALLQALSCRLPVLASEIEGNTAVLGQSHPGLFPPTDPTALATLITTATKTPEKFLAPHAKIPTCREAASALKAIYARAA